LERIKDYEEVIKMKMEINREAEIWMRNEDTKIKAVKDKKEKEIFKKSNSDLFDFLFTYLINVLVLLLI
jgi:hypothetical protein